MIQFHYFTWRADFMRMQGLPIGAAEKGTVRCCHVYSDLSTKELVAWGKEHSVPPGWLHYSRLAHFDLWGERLGLCPNVGVTHKEFVADVSRAIRIRRAGLS